MALFSIVIPAYNNSELIGFCLDSILKQSYSEWEAIVVDDCSTDDMQSVIKSYADKNAQIKTIRQPENRGLHLARKAGTECASGDYVMYLDADDTLADESTLEKLASALSGQMPDILRFGLIAEAVDGTSSDAAKGFAEWSNADTKTLEGCQISRTVFASNENWRAPWHMTHRLFKTELAKNAFAQMTNRPLRRAEDAYEFLVVSSLATNEIARCDILGYRYRMGSGVTNSKTLSASKFLAESASKKACYEAAFEYAKSFHARNLYECVCGLQQKLIESIANDLNERVSGAERAEAEAGFDELVGHTAAAKEYWRFVRDRSWRYLANDNLPNEEDELYDLLETAESSLASVPHNEVNEVLPIRQLAEQYLAEIDHRRSRSNVHDNIRIYVSTHKQVDSFDSSILRLVQVGAEQSSHRFWDTLHDDVGDSISHLNQQYCELTAQYWAWKNIDAEYYGFCHYRRYFNFSDTRYNENVWGEVVDDFIDDQAQQKYGLDDESIARAVEGYDIITTDFKDLRKAPGNRNTPVKQWQAADQLHDEDLASMIAILIDKHPDYEQDAIEFLNGNLSCFCNMYIMRKQLFFDYCNWLFPLLNDFVESIDTSTYNNEALRTPGHLAERLFNIYYMHQQRCGANWKAKTLQCVHFTNPEKTTKTASKPTAATMCGMPVIPVVLAADDNYAPMLTTTIHSMLENASKDYFYDITVLTTDISASNQQIMQSFLTQGRAASIQFFNVWSLLKSYELTTNNPHIGVETYYRFLIQDVLPHYNKVLYLDSDLIVRGDVSELYAIGLGNNMLAAATDVDYLGILNLSNSGRMDYTKNVLQLNDPYQYFQAGVLVLNTAVLREEVSVSEWLERAQDKRLIFNDQDILNMRCQGRVAKLDMHWNVMHNGWDRINIACKFAPASVFEEYLTARNNEKVIHYAGSEKPWNTFGCDRASEYWRYARETPYYEELVAKLAIDGEEGLREERLRRLREQPLIGDESPIRKLADPLMPYGSRRREIVRNIALRVKKNH